MDEFLANLTDHRIEGIARMGETPFSCPLFSQIDGNLWQGGCPVGTAPKEFRFIINLYPWGKYGRHATQVYTEAYLYDGSDVPDETLLAHLADQVNACRRAGMTLVHCQAGLNRSALVAGLALVRSGMDPDAAILLLRRKRSEAVLCNEAFEQWLIRQRPPS